MTMISVPFSFTAVGGVAVARSPEASAAARLTVLINTAMGERAMRPTYGTNVSSKVFENIGPLEQSSLEQSVREAAQTYDPDIGIEAINLIEPDEQGTLVLIVSFSVTDASAGVTTAHIARIDVGGQVTEEERRG